MGTVAIAGISSTSAPSLRRRSDIVEISSAGRVTRTLQPCKRQLLVPGELVGQAAHAADHDDCRRLDARTLRLLGKRGHRGDNAPLTCGRTLLQHRRRSVGAHARVQQARHDIGKRTDAHEEHERALRAHERLEVDVVIGAGALVAGDDVQRRREIAVRHGNAVVGGNGDGRRDAGHDFVGHAMLGEQLELLAAAAEHERVAALQAHDLVAGERLVEQHLADLLLAHRVVRSALAHVDRARVARNAGQHAIAHERVVHDHVGLLQHVVALAREQPRIARASADKPNLAHRPRS